jgi:crossover junction endodeoxyribonuclease RuvC
MILAVDPGTICLGYCAVEPKNSAGRFLSDSVRLVEAGEVAAPAKLKRVERLTLIHHGLRKVFERLKPRVLVLERAYVGRGAQAAIAIGEARGLVIGLAASWKCHIHEYTANEARRLIGAGGKATKTEAQRMAARLLGRCTSFREDEGDAAVLAVAYGLGLPAPADRQIATASPSRP